MGCASSKQKRCRHCQSPYSPVPRSYSMHVHHPPEKKGDSYHLVALTSSTLGSIKLDSAIRDGNEEVICNGFDHKNDDSLKSKDFSVGLIEAKTWSNMINEKIPKVVPKTPTRTPPGEPETINAWELMEGLEDTSPFRSPIHVRSFSFDVVRDPNPMPTSPFDRPKSRFQENGSVSPKPMWLQMADNNNQDLNSDSGVPEFDPEIISNFRKSLEELSPDHEKQLGIARNDSPIDTEIENDTFVDHKWTPCDREKEKLIVYFTSLRGVRKTYEDCCHVRVILKSLGVRVDERDVSMHSGFKDELKELLKDGFSGGGLPKVFLGSKYIGGADEIRRLNEDGQLEKLLECCEKVDDDGGDGGGACEACGDIRFVPCETCSGSCKIYYEAEEEETEEGEEEDYGFQRCPDCNENGLIRCPICC
ncbi:Glutaredoxin [Trema orientale]|uniref:Glutaredoxin n=1 Tax=Trema orientale TaxID=63057 RepID=A0A2P5D277_TREOI|nr:Glutaredoxin [Trema orientale]